MRTMLAFPLLAALGCAAVPPDEAPRDVSDPEQSCDTEGLGHLVGEAATQALGAEAIRLSGARTLRWIRPGDAVTMDYRPDRLNIHLDASNRVERFACG